MAWSDRFEIFEGEGLSIEPASFFPHVHGDFDTPNLVCTSLPAFFDAPHRENLSCGLQKLRDQHPDTSCRVYLGEDQREHLAWLLDLGCEVHLGNASAIPRDLWPLLALEEGRNGGTTFTRPERFWYAADDVSRTKLLAESTLKTWRVLDTWSGEPEDYCALQAHGWGTRACLPASGLLVSFFKRRAGCSAVSAAARDFLTIAIYPLLAPDGYLSIRIPGTPPARHWVALDIEWCMKSNPASELMMLTSSATCEEEIPTMTWKGYEMPVAGVVSCHQQLPLFSEQLARVHDSLLSTLQDFHHLAREKNIRYSLHAANLTGFYTNGGFIPWDDDIDLLVHPGDFQILEELWASCPPASNLRRYHRGFSNEFTRTLFIRGREYEFLSSEPGREQILMKLRPAGSSDLFPNDAGGIDLTSIVEKNGIWYERWALSERRPGPEIFEKELEKVVFAGVDTFAFRRESVECLYREKYPFDWSRHPSLQRSDVSFTAGGRIQARASTSQLEAYSARDGIENIKE